MSNMRNRAAVEHQITVSLNSNGCQTSGYPALCVYYITLAQSFKYLVDVYAKTEKKRLNFIRNSWS